MVSERATRIEHRGPAVLLQFLRSGGEEKSSTFAIVALNHLYKAIVAFFFNIFF